jgi:RNA polymerase sigma factor (sigma-70 family)
MEGVPTLTPSLEMEALLDAASRGDRGAFAQLYDRVSAKLYGIALRILRRQSVAEEVVQEAFLSIWQHAGNYDPGRGSPLGWMATIVRNRALDRLRRDPDHLPLDKFRDGTIGRPSIPARSIRQSTPPQRDGCVTALAASTTISSGRS